MDRTGDHAADGIDDLPLPPYPADLGHPLSHTLRTMPDVLSFRDRAMAERDLVRIHLLGPGDVYHLAHPSYLERVLRSDRDAFGKSEDFRIAFGEGLVAAEGGAWRRQRELLQPFFSPDGLAAYAGEMAAAIRRRVDRWTAGDRIDLQAEMRGLTLDVLFSALFGRDLDPDGDREIREAAERLHDWFVPTSYPLPTWIPTPARRRFKRGRRRLRRVAARLLDAKGGDAPASPAAAADLLSALVGLRESEAVDAAVLSDAALRDQVVTLIFAGHDTTASALAFAVYELARHPSIRDRFHAEVDRLAGPPTADDLDALAVTERIVTEALRRYPPVYTIPREATRPVAMDGHRIPAGAPVWLAVRQVHHDERFYDAPEEFRPERWGDEAGRDRPEFAYAPFGGGPRLCIGRQFALVEAKLALATIGRRYDLDPTGDAGDPPITADLTLRMSPGTRVRVTDR